MNMDNRTDNKLIMFLLDNKYRIFRHILLQGVILAISIGVFFDTPDQLNLSENRILGWISYYLFINMLVYVNIGILYPCFLKKNKSVLYSISLLLFTLFALMVMIILQNNFYDIAVIQQNPSAIAIFFSIASSLLAIFLFLGGISAFLFFKHYVLTQFRINEIKKETAKSELVFLKNQINPHFLFNMLNNANILVEDEPDTASKILIQLDDLLQYQLNDSTKETVRLEADIAFLRNYLELEKVRHDNFGYSVQIDGNVNGIEVSPLLFIPFVENAVKYNSYNENESFIEVIFKVEGSKLCFTCINSKVEKVTANKVGGLGLVNIRKRLNLLYNKDYVLEKVETKNSYTINLILKI